MKVVDNVGEPKEANSGGMERMSRAWNLFKGILSVARTHERELKRSKPEILMVEEFRKLIGGRP